MLAHTENARNKVKRLGALTHLSRDVHSRQDRRRWVLSHKPNEICRVWKVIRVVYARSGNVELITQIFPDCVRIRFYHPFVVIKFNIFRQQTYHNRRSQVQVDQPLTGSRWNQRSVQALFKQNFCLCPPFPSPSLWFPCRASDAARILMKSKKGGSFLFHHSTRAWFVWTDRSFPLSISAASPRSNGQPDVAEICSSFWSRDRDSGDSMFALRHRETDDQF